MAAVFGACELGEDGEATLENVGPRSIISRRTKICYYVLTDNLGEGEPEVMTATNLPLISTGIYKGYVCSRKSARQTHLIRNHPTYGVPCALYEVDVEFNNNIEPGSGDASSDPLDKRAVVRWHGEFKEYLIGCDFEDTPLRTAAGEIILLQKKRVVPTLEITRFEPFPFNPNTFLNFAGTKNSHPFWGAARGQAYMLPMEVEETIINGLPYNQVTYRIKFDFLEQPTGWNLLRYSAGSWVPIVDGDGYWSPWDALVPNQGYLVRPAAGQPAELGDKRGNAREIQLKADGTAAADADLPFYLRFVDSPSSNFNALSLGPY